jgi:tripartite-type tricarboxylate transporter receptor subunit TctC
MRHHDRARRGAAAPRRAAAGGLAALAAAVLARPRIVVAQEAFPSRPIRIVVPFAAGGIADSYARVLGKAAGERLGQPFVVENKPGAGTTIGTEAVVRAKPDGYTLLVGSAPLVTNPGLLEKLPYDAMRDLAPVIRISAQGFLVSVHEKQPYRTFGELVEAARKAEVPYASPGNGTLMHLVGQLMNVEYGTRLVHVAYRGSAPAVQDVSAGQVGVLIDPISTTLPAIRQGRLRALATTNPTRLPALPEVPTVRELGFPKLEAVPFSGILAPAGTPPEVIATLNRAFNEAMRQPDVRETIEVKLQSPLIGGTAEDWGRFLQAETERWVPLIKRLGIKAE